MRPNYIHIDFKGVVFSAKKLMDVLTVFHDFGFNGVVMEYEDRIPWKSWPQTAGRTVYSRSDIERILKKCRELGLEVVPLIQTLGHLEWLLKHDDFCTWRENGFVSELCPSRAGVAERLEEWIDEVVSLHPESRFIHLGADETFHLGSCPHCSSRDKLQIYTDHIGRLCRHVLKKNLHPMIWADMFWREKRPELAAYLPEETILVDWQYVNTAPYPTTKALQNTGRKLMGASGTMIGDWEQCYHMANPPQRRVDNVLAWNRFGAEENIGIIHTAWTRAGSMWNTRGSIHGAVPGILAGGSLERWKEHPWRNFTAEVSSVMEREWPTELEECAEKVLTLAASNEFERQTLRYWHLALRFHALAKGVILSRMGCASLKRVEKFVGKNDAVHWHEFHENPKCLSEKIKQWEAEGRQFWQDNELSDTEEFFSTHSGMLLDELASVT